VSNKFTFIDLFAGIGGMRLAFENVGGKCIFTSEWDKYAVQTYQANHGAESIAGDITKVKASEIPDHDVLVAGFPCQPFSIAGVSKNNSLGRKHGFEDETRGTLFFDVARIIKEKKPHAFLLENVRNLLSHDGGNTFRVIHKTLTKLGYDVHYRVLNGQHFTPQRRLRIVIVGFRKPVPFSFDSKPLPTMEGVTMAQVLHRRSEPVDGRFIVPGGINPRYVLSDKLWAFLQGYAEKHKAAGNGFGCSVVGPSDVARTLSARYYKDGSEILVGRGSMNPRKLTPRECARLMGFPDSFQIPVSDTRAYKQFGNSVVVPLMEHVASMMVPHLLKLKKEKE
jgi:DNA (cytosine-5)-methyltransferase 1